MPQERDCALGLAWLGLSGGTRPLSMIKRVGLQGVWGASPTDLLRWGMSRQAMRTFIAAREGFDLCRARAAVEHKGQAFIPFGAPLYPVELCHLECPPPGLFVHGSFEALERFTRLPRITVVGTRKATPEGLAATKAFAEAMGSRGVAVVSGMALGIDAQAHRAALDAGAATLAVLGCGADVVYPPRHQTLYDRIVERGAVASELPPGTHPTKWTFPYRNRLLAALGDAVLVVEGSHKSGALQTAGWALQLGRTVFCVPGSIYKETSEGCNALIYHGASPALKPDALVEDFLLATRMERGRRGPAASARVECGEQMKLLSGGPTGRPCDLVMEALRVGPQSVDDLVSLTGLSVREVNAVLGELGVGGAVCRAGPGMFLRER